MPKWTLEQLDAITHDNENIIVSAGAGSGKTAVLTQRVIEKLKKGIHVDELLVLTFTKAAAHEMKERIRKAIKKDPSLKEELSRIDNSYITTFDSYAFSVVKKYHYLLNISKDVSIIDSSVIYLKKKEMIDEIFLQLYESKDSCFLKLIGDFCLKSDDEIKKYILNISNKLDLKYDKDIYLNNYLSNSFDDQKISNDILEFEKLLLRKVNKINDALDELSNYIDVDYLNKVNECLNALINADDYNSIRQALDIKIPSLPKNSVDEAKYYKNSINELVKELKELCCFISKDEIKSTIISTKDYIEAIIKVIVLLDEKVNNYKRNNDIYEFVDISKLAIKVLKENSDVCEAIKKSFKEIMIDEYQDTNDLQEAFVNMINNNNCYMVGDIKQSIYRFRNANPYIFKNKYDNYALNNGGYKIDLTKNFRSRVEVLDDINTIFNLIMHDDIGGANYKATHQMVFGNTTYINEGKTNQNNHLEIYKYLYDNSNNYKKEELEAFIIASDIRDKVNSKYQVFDKDNLVLRDIKYDDFVILMDRTSKFDLYKKIFEYMNIPLMKYTDTSITSEVDLLVIKNIIKLIIKVRDKIYDEEFKYAFLSLGRSYLFEIDDEQLFDMITNNQYLDSEILNKVYNILPIIDNKTTSELMDKIIWEFNFYEKLIKVGNVSQSMERLSYLVDMATTLDNLGYDLDDFLSYLENLIKSEYDIKLSYSSVSNDSVKIMTIHKSKGLEYHICYFPGMYSKFNISDLKEKITYDPLYGIITPYFKNGFNDTIYKDLMKNKYMLEEISEKIRLFYVALTRAKEKMIILEPCKEDEEVTNKDPVNYMSFLDMIKNIKPYLKDFYTNVDFNKINLSKDYNKMKKNNYVNDISKTNKKLIKHKLELDYYNVDNIKYSKDIDKLSSIEEKNKMHLGSIIHYLLEGIDFLNPKVEELNIDEFYKKKLKLFFNLDWNFNNAKIYKEYQFSYMDDNLLKNGIIDLMLEYDDEIKIIDYKLKEVDDDNYLKQLVGYKRFVSTKTNKKVKVYLYSIIDGYLKEL